MNTEKNFYKNKLRQLDRIHIILMMLYRKGFITSNPRLQDAWGRSSMAAFLFIMIGILSGEIKSTYFLSVVFFISLAVGFFAYKLSPRASTWMEEIDNKLTEYDPVNAAEYRQLQLEIRNSSMSNLPAFLNWVITEKITIQNILKPKCLPLSTPQRNEGAKINESKECEIKFVNKHISTQEESSREPNGRKEDI